MWRDCLEPVKSVWMELCVGIVCDEWSDPQRRPLINIMKPYIY